MKKRGFRARAAALTLLAASAAGIAAMTSGCGADTAGYGCDDDAQCPDDLSCEENQQGAVCSDGFCGCDYSQSICTTACSTDDDCPYDLVCNKASICGGAPDLCGRA